MVELGVALLVVGAALLVAEAHVPGGVLGVAGGVALAAGAALAIGGAGGGAVALVIGAILARARRSTGLWLALATRKGARHAAAAGRVRAARRSAAGLGVVRRWNGGDGQVFVDGALWRARPELAGRATRSSAAGDAVVVERVSGLTLAVRRAEEWEEP